MKLPITLENFNVYIGNSTDPVGVSDIDLPEVVWKKVSVDLAGTGGQIDVPLIGQSDPMQATLTAPALTTRAIRAAASTGEMIVARGAIQQKDSITKVTSILGLAVFMRGGCSSFKVGKMKRGETMDSSLAFDLDYINVFMDGESVFEHDKWNNKTVIDGVDITAAVNAAI